MPVEVLDEGLDLQEVIPYIVREIG